MKSAAATEYARKKTYISRKDCIKKKMKEISTLSDIQACMICLGPHGIWETWPEDSSQVDSMINSYKIYQQRREGNSKKKVEACEFETNKTTMIKKNIYMDRLHELLRDVDSKLVAVNNRIDLLNMMEQQQLDQTNGVGTDCGRTIQEEIDQVDISSFGVEAANALFPREIYEVNPLQSYTPLEAWIRMRYGTGCSY